MTANLRPQRTRSAFLSSLPLPSSLPITPSVLSCTSAVPSKQLFTPDDDDDDMLDQHASMVLDEPVLNKPRKKRPAAGTDWVEGTPPPSETLIDLDSVTVLVERKTRSGKSFDGNGASWEGWV